MKNIHYIFCCFILLLTGYHQAQASHIKAIDMSYTCLGNNQYEVTMQLYRDCNGIASPPVLPIDIIGMGSCAGNAFRIHLNSTSNLIISSVCSTLNTSCNGGSAPATEVHIYTGIITLPPTFSGCPWRLSAQLCCLSSSITNILGSASSAIYTELIIVDSVMGCNNSPVSSSKPTFSVCPNNPISISNLMTDPDGDSLVYSLAASLSRHNTPVVFQAGLSATNPFNITTSSSIVLDSATGALTFSGLGGQVANFDIVIHEYRNGQLIGINRKSLHFNIMATCNNNPPNLTMVSRLVNSTWVPQGTTTTFDVCPGEPLSFQMDLTDVDVTDSLSISNFHSTVLDAYPNAVIQHFYSGTGNNQLTLQVDIPATALDGITVVVTDNTCPYPSRQAYPIRFVPRPSCTRVEGFVFADTSNNCILDAGEDSLGGYLITFSRSGFSMSFSTDATGYYNVPLDTGTFTVTLSAAHPYRSLCTSAQTLVNPAGATLVRHDLPVQTNVFCPFMEVDIAANRLIRCLDNVYVIQYCNKGTIDATMASIDVTLDSLFVVDSSTLPIVSQTGFTYTFNLGTVAVNQCNTFRIYGRLDTACTSVLGRSFCATAHVFPDTNCVGWGGASLLVEGRCHNDSVGFRIANVGQLAMSGPSTYSVVEDNILFHTGSPISLGAGTVSPWVNFPATGAFYRLAINQEAGYPWGKEASAIVEGCLSSLFPSNPITTGLVNTFSLDDFTPYLSTDCQPSIGSYDPNDKQAFPIGYGGAHSIEPNVDLVYRIRFQNTGTAPAQDVIIRDTLSAHLDVTTLVPTVASHAYTWQLNENNVLAVTFANIMLPDSGANFLASQGFVDFKIKQQPNNPLGTIINNSAAIYFDRNEPIITNTVFHTIDENFILFTQLPSIEQGDALTVLAFPNPFDQATTLQVTSDQTYEQLTLTVYNALGQLIAQTTNQSGAQTINFQRNGLATGLYFYRLEGDGKLLHTGQLMAQ